MIMKTDNRDRDKIRPYGDHWDDGKMQFSFTLPVPAGEKAREAARIYLERLGLENVQICAMEAMGEAFSFFIAYGFAKPHISLSQVPVHAPEFSVLPFEELLQTAREKIRKRIVVVGATTGSDAHTVGIDAILSIKGIAGDRGLEYYPIFKVINLRAQVDNRHLIERALEHQADAVLVSKMVTQQDQHLADLKTLSQMIRSERRFPAHLVKIAGGPRIDHRIAKSVGFDAGFGPGTKPSEVANFIVHEMIRRLHGAPKKAEGRPESRMDGHAAGPAPKKRRSLFAWLSGRGQDS